MLLDYNSQCPTINNGTQYLIYCRDNNIQSTYTPSLLYSTEELPPNSAYFQTTHKGKILYCPINQPSDELLSASLNEQQSTLNETLDSLQFSEASKKTTRHQYEHFVFVNGLASPINQAKHAQNELKRISASDNIVILNNNSSDNIEDISGRVSIEISISHIRAVTGYKPVKWQQNLLEDFTPFIYVVGSRQIGKSMTLAHMALERSFKPKFRVLVTSFSVSTTREIRDYLLEFAKNFDNNFSYNKREDYIENLTSGGKIWFRTLADEGRGVRGMHVDLVIIDEAAFVPNNIHEKVLLATVATTNGQIIAISSPDKRNWFYEGVAKAKKKEPLHSLYEITVDQNPFISDNLRAYIQSNKHKPNIRQEYYCEFLTDQDALIQPVFANFFPSISAQGHFVVGFDPARKHDRSALSFCYISQGLITVIHSTPIPDEHKVSWDKQAIYIISKLKELKHPNIHFGLDVTGVGDGVISILKSHGLKVDFAIQYTGGTNSSEDTKTYPGTHFYKVPKAALISNTLDFNESGSLLIYKYTNSELLEEISFLERTTNKLGQIAFESSFFKDTFNSLMIALWRVKAKDLLSKTLHHHSELESYDYETQPFINETLVYKLPKNRHHSNGNVF